MGLYNMMGIYSIIPITIYLTISFFVLFAAGKAESKGLKTFGQVIAVLLWICAFLMLVAGIWMMTTKHRPWDKCGKMCGKHMMKMEDKDLMHMKMMHGVKDNGCSAPKCPVMKK